MPKAKNRKGHKQRVSKRKRLAKQEKDLQIHRLTKKLKEQFAAEKSAEKEVEKESSVLLAKEGNSEAVIQDENPFELPTDISGNTERVLAATKTTID